MKSQVTLNQMIMNICQHMRWLICSHIAQLIRLSSLRFEDNNIYACFCDPTILHLLNIYLLWFCISGCSVCDKEFCEFAVSVRLETINIAPCSASIRFCLAETKRMSSILSYSSAHRFIFYWIDRRLATKQPHSAVSKIKLVIILAIHYYLLLTL